MIYFDADKQIFHLTNGQVSYIIGVEEKGLLAQLYYGKAVSGYHGGRHYPRLSALSPLTLRRTRNVSILEIPFYRKSVVLAVVIFGYQALI